MTQPSEVSAKCYPIVHSSGRSCYKCGKQPESPKASYCNACRAAYQREHRKGYRRYPIAIQKSNARSYLHVYIKRGKIIKKPCEKLVDGVPCGNPKVEAHHHDYSKPLDVKWLCVKHHLALSGMVQHVERKATPAIG